MAALFFHASHYPGSQFLLKINNLLDLCQKPPVNFGELKDFFDGHSGAQRVADEKDALCVRHAQLLGDEFAREDVAVPVDFLTEAPRLAVAAQARAANFERA